MPSPGSAVRRGRARAERCSVQSPPLTQRLGSAPGALLLSLQLADFNKENTAVCFLCAFKLETCPVPTVPLEEVSTDVPGAGAAPSSASRGSAPCFPACFPARGWGAGPAVSGVPSGGTRAQERLGEGAAATRAERLAGQARTVSVRPGDAGAGLSAPGLRAECLPSCPLPAAALPCAARLARVPASPPAALRQREEFRRDGGLLYSLPGWHRSPRRPGLCTAAAVSWVRRRCWSLQVALAWRGTRVPFFSG